MDVATVEVEDTGRFPEVFSTILLSFFPVSVTTHKTPPRPTDVTGTLVDVEVNMGGPAPIGTTTPAPRVYPV